MTQAYLNAGEIELRKNGDDKLQLILNDEIREMAPPRRALPLSDPGRYIVFYDNENKEIGIVRDLQEVNPESREILQAALQQAYSIVQVARVLKIEKEPTSGQTRWRVEIASPGEPTKKSRLNGSASGAIREFNTAGPENIQTAHFPQIYILDTDRKRYEIPNFEELDLDSRRALEYVL